MESVERVEVLNKAQISQLNKKDLEKYAFNLSNAYSKLYDKLFNQKTGILPILESQIGVITSINNQLLKKITAVERTSNSISQYSRKETIELHGFNPETPANEVEDKVLNIINSINNEDDYSKYTPEDIQACHKLKDRSKIICKFVSRKRMRNVINNRKKLKGMDLKNQGIPGKLFINESMAPSFKGIDWRCRQLKKAKLIKECWFFNGNYTLQNLKEEKKQVSHINDILDYLGMKEEELEKICLEWKDKKVADSPSK